MSGLGAEFKTAREERDLTLAAVGERLHIRPEFLEAIEEERWSVVGDATSLRGLLRTYARFLGLDGSAAVARFNAEYAPPVEGRGPARRFDGGAFASIGIGAAAVLLICVAGVKVASSEHFHHHAQAPLVAGSLETAPPATATPSTSPRPHESPRPSASPRVLATPLAEATAVPTVTPSASPAATATSTVAPRPSVSPVRTAAPERSPVPTPVPTPVRTPRATPSPSLSPTPLASAATATPAPDSASSF